ncbi:MAG TPA: nitrilase-related carbon-nitrogen hydrolase, partial [Desulfobacteria bacterium]|nr:nitrilase-related carbon-nitrogen hydrolase [Desulfobacteria bacterium]
MSKPFRLALAQVNATVGDIAGNVRKVVFFCDRAREAGATLVVFPEMVLPGYPPEDLLLRASFVEENLAAWREVAENARGVAVVAGFVDRDGKGRVCNAAGVA